MESTDFEDFLRQLSEQNIEIGKGNSKKYGEVIKYKLPDDTRCHLGYSLGRFYGDDAINKRIARHIAYEKAVEEQKARQKAK